MNIYDVIEIVAALCAVVFIFSPHEFAHAWAAYKNGDPTAKMMGRYSLNPLKHIDPLGFVATALVGFGWAKPVPINPNNFKNYRKGLFLTAIAGVVTNYIIAFFAYALYCVVTRFAFPQSNTTLYYFCYFFDYFFYILFAYSLSIVVFNLLPLYPLDGFRIVESCTRQINPVRRFLREYGQMILIILIVESFICNAVYNYFAIEWIDYCNILGYILKFAKYIISFPITICWDWILTI
jgi:Zn-dependent protease